MADILLLDACVVSNMIRLYDSKIDVVSLVTQHVGAVYVPNVILQEVRKAFNIDDPRDYSLNVLETPSRIRFDAARLHNEREKISENDYCCFLLAKERDYVCVTNDKDLQNTCIRHGVKSKWELELLLSLYECGAIDYDYAVTYLLELKKISSRISPKVERDYMERLERLKSEKDTND
ncbi:MAG: PIN domain-containing protein [Thermoguttaceae bacterium]|nr:PIN domain-containing protein [Thermoguttaceae bacterium]